MKTLLLAVAIVMVSTAARACDLTDGDFKALSSSPSALTSAAFSALAPENQKPVCDTRAFIKQFKGVIKGDEVYSSKYLSPDENHSVVSATNGYLKTLLKYLGMGS